MFRLTRGGAATRAKVLNLAGAAWPARHALLTAANGLVDGVPPGFVHDVSRSDAGRGRQAFALACAALRRWEQFDLGWVTVAAPWPPLALGALVAVESRTGLLWSTNVCRITDVFESPTRFGFVYATTLVHVADGQERFVVDWAAATDTVCYLIEAVSRPRHPLARAGYPFTRLMQRRFARDSHARMRRAVSGLD